MSNNISYEDLIADEAYLKGFAAGQKAKIKSVKRAFFLCNRVLDMFLENGFDWNEIHEAKEAISKAEGK